MLTSLAIRDFLLVPVLDLDPGEGFTALTGETGAGKSILLAALGFAMGARAPKGVVRQGAKSASVTVTFEPPKKHPVWELLNDRGLEVSPGESLILRRIAKTGAPTRGFINDQAVGASLLQDVGALLIEIHGQHEGQGLLNTGRHRVLLDGIANTSSLLQSVALAWEVWGNAKDTRTELEARLERAAMERSYLEHALDELDALAPEVGEAGELAMARASMQASERVAETIEDAERSLTRANVENALASSERALGRLQAMPALSGENATGELAQRVKAASQALERAMIETLEARAALGFAAAACEYSPSQLETSEARLFALRAVARKHNVDPDELAPLQEKLRAQLDEIVHSDSALSKAKADEAKARLVYLDAAKKLTTKRKTGARRLEKAIARELGPLKLAKTRFRVAISERPESEAGPSGLNDILFEVATNEGSDFGPLNRIASGGEMARLSLAISVCLADVSPCQTLIFDEADVGVGGAVAAAVGERLSGLGEDRQVFAITHSPQVAAAALRQLQVAKSVTRGKTKTSVSMLAPKARKEEIARMLAGSEITREARAAAGRLLAGV